MAYRFLTHFFILIYFALGVHTMSHASLSEDEFTKVSQLMDLVNDRFKLQKEVAAYKHNTNMPSFIPGREQQILADIRNIAITNHLDLQSVQNFIDIQMRASVDVQLKWRSHWKRTDFPTDYQIKELDNQIRPELSRITKDIVQHIGRNIDTIGNPDNFEDIAKLFSEIIEDPFITGHHRDAILQALVRIKKV